jgi:CheY-like chemotaxis protein
LLVEDEDEVRSVTARTLVAEGHVVLEAGSVTRAFELADGEQPIDLLLSDVVMPKLSGPQLAAKLRSLYPGLKVLFCSGHAEDMVAQRGILPSNVHFLGKPYRPHVLLTKVHEVLLSDEPGALGRVALAPADSDSPALRG